MHRLISPGISIDMSLVERVIDHKNLDSFSMLEIGVGSCPFPTQTTVLIDSQGRPNPNFDFSGGSSYLGVDNGTAISDHSYLGSQTEIATEARGSLSRYEDRIRGVRPGEDIELRYMDAFDLAGRVGAYNQVMMTNVLSSMISREMARRLLELASDVLTPGGLFVSRETFTPEYMDEQALSDIMGTLEFAQVELVPCSTRGCDYDALSQHYGLTDFDIGIEGICTPGPDRYFCLALAGS